MCCSSAQQTCGAVGARIGRDELLLPREDELDGPPGGTRQGGDVALEVEVALRAEAAAEERDDDADVRLRNLEHLRDSAPRSERNLRRRPDGDAVALPLREDRAR